MDEYTVIAWSAVSFIGGLGIGAYAVRTLMGGASAGVRLVSRRGFEWARRDISTQAPATRDTFVRLVTPTAPAPSLEDEGRTLTFAVHDNRSGLDRDVCFSIAIVNRFMKLDGPTRGEWHGDNNTYSKLLQVGKHYNWLIPSDSKGYQWAVWLGTRERRIRALEMWASR